MSFWKKLFSLKAPQSRETITMSVSSELGSSRQSETSGGLSGSDDILSLVCPHCGQMYLIGKDSIVVTKVAAYEGFAEMGARVLSSNLFHGPDLVMYGGDLTIEVQQMNMERVVQIRADLRSGVSRSWRCAKCQDGDSTPIPYVEMAETAKITVVMICTEGAPLREDGMIQGILDLNQIKRLIEGRIRVVTLGNLAITQVKTREEKFTQAVASLIKQGIEPNAEKMEQYDITDPADGTVYRVIVCPP